VPRRSIAIAVADRSSAHRADRRSHRSTAIPAQSNPDPRFDVDPGTRTVTPSVMRSLEPLLGGME